MISSSGRKPRSVPGARRPKKPIIDLHVTHAKIALGRNRRHSLPVQPQLMTLAIGITHALEDPISRFE
jgi:hypothetical protein